METVEVATCNICNAKGGTLSLLSAHHKDYGLIKVCRACWIDLYSKNRMVAGSGSSGKGASSPCSSCAGCSFR